MSRSRTIVFSQRLCTSAALFTLLGAVSAAALPTPLQVVSRASGGEDALLAASAQSPAVSADGRYVAFLSDALDYGPAVSGTVSVFVKDVLTGQIELVSRSSGGASANGDCFGCVMTPDARFVAFESRATNLVPNDTNGQTDVFVHDRATATTERVNLSKTGQQAQGGDDCNGCGNLAMSADGRCIAFYSAQGNLMPGESGGTNNAQVFLRDRLLGTTEVVSARNDGIRGDLRSGHHGFSITPDGRYVAFPSDASTLAPYERNESTDTNGTTDIYLRDRERKETERITVVPHGQPFSPSFSATISGDGQYVAFQSREDGLIPDHQFNGNAIYLRYRQGNTMWRIDRSSGGETAQLDSFDPVFAQNGQYVLFTSYAPNLVAGDTNQCADLFLRDLAAGTTERVSVSTNEAQGNRDSGFGRYSISPDGRFVAFASDADNLVPGDTNARRDVFLRDRTAGTTIRVSERSGAQAVAGAASSHPAASSGGRFVAFVSTADNLVPNDTNGVADIFVVDTSTGVTERVSVSSGGEQANAPSGISSHRFRRWAQVRPAITPDGRYVAFHSQASNLAPGDTNGWDDYFVRDRKLGLTERVYVDFGGGATLNAEPPVSPPAITPDGRYVVFESPTINSEVWRTNSPAIFLRDRKLGRTEQVSLGNRNLIPNQGCYFPSISDDGRFVSFETGSSNIPPQSNSSIHDVYVRDRRARTLERVSAPYATPWPVDHYTHSGQLSGDGRYIAFVSRAANLVPGDTNEREDVFVRDRQARKNERISVAGDGMEVERGGFHPSISRDGRYVAFVSDDDMLVGGDSNGAPDVFVRDRLAGHLDRASAALDGSEAAPFSHEPNRMFPALTPEGFHVAFSTAAALRSDDTNGTTDVYLRTLGGPVPDAPRNLRARVQAGQIVLSWQSTSPGVLQFGVERKAGTSEFTAYATLGADARTFVDAAPMPGVVYTYRVVAANLRGRSGPSNLASAGLPALPEAPEGLLATVDGRAIRLDWADRSTIERGFSLERREGDGPYRVLRTLPQNTTTYRDLRVRAGVQYTYRVRATHPKGRSPYSNEAFVVLPP